VESAWELFSFLFPGLGVAGARRFSKETTEDAEPLKGSLGGPPDPRQLFADLLRFGGGVTVASADSLDLFGDVFSGRPDFVYRLGLLLERRGDLGGLCAATELLAWVCSSTAWATWLRLRRVSSAA